MSLCYGMKDGELQFYNQEYEESEELQDDGITLSPKYGLNPSMEICTWCGKSLGIILYGMLEDDKEAPKEVCLGHLCEDCIKEFQETNKVLFFEINDSGELTGKYIVMERKDLPENVLEDLGDSVVAFTK